MSRHYKILSFLFIPLLAFCCLQGGCKKKDVYPAQQLPQIKGVVPASAIAGTPVTIRGVNLKSVDSVRFGTVLVAGFNASDNTDTAIHVIVPDSLPVGNLSVQVYLRDGKGYSASPFTVLLTPPVPKISSVDPVTAFPGDQVIISGTNFAQVTHVRFGGVEASFAPTLDTNGKISAIVPMKAPGGPHYITVVNGNGYDSITFNVNLAPVISSVTPGFGKEGDDIIVKGARFTDISDVQLAGESLTFTNANDSMINFKVPADGKTGYITVSNANGTATSLLSFTVQQGNVPPYVVYDDALSASWWTGGTLPAVGWSNTTDMANTSPVKSGTHSIRVDYTGTYGGFQIGINDPGVDLSTYTVIKLSIYGGPGTAGNLVKVYLNADDPHGKTLTLSEGSWTDYTIPLSDLGGASSLSVIQVQEFSNVAPETIYIDNITVN